MLRPFEYTRLDSLVDVMFSAARDLEPALSDAGEQQPDMEEASTTPSGWDLTDGKLLQKKRDLIISTLSRRLGAPLVKKSRAQYWSADHDRRVVCTISKRYERSSGPRYARYWYAYHPQWDAFLSEVSDAHLVLGCMDLPTAFAIPRSVIFGLLGALNVTETERGKYWHLHLSEPTEGRIELVLPREPENLDLSRYAVQLGNEPGIEP